MDQPLCNEYQFQKMHFSAHLQEDGTLAVVPRDSSAKDSKDPWASYFGPTSHHFHPNSNFYLQSCSQDFTKNSCHPGLETALQHQTQYVVGVFDMINAIDYRCPCPFQRSGQENTTTETTTTETSPVSALPLPDSDSQQAEPQILTQLMPDPEPLQFDDPTEEVVNSDPKQNLEPKFDTALEPKGDARLVTSPPATALEPGKPSGPAALQETPKPVEDIDPEPPVKGVEPEPARRVGIPSESSKPQKELVVEIQEGLTNSPI